MDLLFYSYVFSCLLAVIFVKIYVLTNKYLYNLVETKIVLNFPDMSYYRYTFLPVRDKRFVNIELLFIFFPFLNVFYAFVNIRLSIEKIYIYRQINKVFKQRCLETRKFILK